MTTNSNLKAIPFRGVETYTVTSDEEIARHFLEVTTVTCANCDKRDKGTPEQLEQRGWWLRLNVLCSIKCLFALADEKIESFNLEGCPF